MKRIIVALALAAFSAAPAAAAERRYSVTDFDRVVVDGPYAVTLATGRPSSARATGTENALQRVSIEVLGRTLRVRPNRSAWGGYPGAAGGPVEIEISTRDLRSVLINGAGSLSIDRAAGLRLELRIEGTGRIAAPALAVDTLVVGMIGSGRVEVAGTARELRASVHGWGDLDASALRTQGSNIVAETAGRISASVARQATVTATGMGEVEIIGAPACTVRGPSAGQVKCGRPQSR